MKTPWHYITWRPPVLDAETEIGIASMTRRRGIPQLTLIFWGLLAREHGFGLASMGLCFAYNYTGLFAGGATMLGMRYWPASGWTALAGVVSLAWGSTVVLGTARYVGWLISLLRRWPPMGKA